MAHERQTLENVTQARNLAMQASGVGGRAVAEGGLSQALGQFFAVAENYPDLKANQNFLALQEELTSTENKIGFARQFYNDQVMLIQQPRADVPWQSCRRDLRFKESESFTLTNEEEREAPKVSF